MRLSALIALFLLYSCLSMRADSLDFDKLVKADRVRMTVSLLPEGKILVTQKVTLQIELSSDRWFLGGTKIDELEIRNVIVPRRSEFAVNSTRKEHGTTWTVQRWKIDMYPQIEGRYTIPSLEVQVTVSGDDNQPVKGSFYTNELSFIAQTPNDLLDQQSDWVASSNVTLNESWDAAFDHLQTGEALTRTVTMEAEDVPAMMLPGFTPETIEGIATYPKSPDLEDKSSRGQSKGIRKDAITYFFEQPGTYTLPEQQFIWWNLNKARVETLTLKEHTFTVTASTAVTEQIAGQAKRHSDNPFPLRRIFIILAASVFIIWIIYRASKSTLAKKTRNRFINWRNRPPSEKDYWKRCINSSTSGKADELLASLYTWLDRGLNDPEIETLEDFAKRFGDTELLNELRRLNQRAYNATSTNAMTPFPLKSLEKARNAWKSNRNPKGNLLKPLNP